jgi:serine/threonine protein kinase
VAKGLEHAHHKKDDRGKPIGLVHRDVSPQNVLISWEGDVKVTDFGIAKARTLLGPSPRSDSSRQLHGKFSYMSPEQARGDELDASSDLFSLGVVLYEAITGTQPFQAPTTNETLRRVAACEYPPLALLKPDMPDEVLHVVSRALAKSPRDRFRSAGDFADALHPLLPSERSLKKALESVLRHAAEVGIEALVDDDQDTPTEVAYRARRRSKKST